MFRNREQEWEMRILNEKVAKLEDRIKTLEDKPDPVPQDVRKEGESWFADKMVQKIVYGAVAVILMAAIGAFTGNVPWLD